MLNDDYRDMLRALSDEGVRFLLVGAYAMAAHGYPRATMDIDIITEATGLQFADVFARSAPVMIDDLEVRVPTIEDLIRNKQATGRIKDLADVEALRALLPDDDTSTDS